MILNNAKDTGNLKGSNAACHIEFNQKNRTVHKNITTNAKVL
jgi:hypothetical protein